MYLTDTARCHIRVTSRCHIRACQSPTIVYRSTITRLITSRISTFDVSKLISNERTVMSFYLHISSRERERIRDLNISTWIRHRFFCEADQTTNCRLVSHGKIQRRRHHYDERHVTNNDHSSLFHLSIASD